MRSADIRYEPDIHTPPFVTDNYALLTSCSSETNGGEEYSVNDQRED